MTPLKQIDPLPIGAEQKIVDSIVDTIRAVHYMHWLLDRQAVYCHALQAAELTSQRENQLSWHRALCEHVWLRALKQADV